MFVDFPSHGTVVKLPFSLVVPSIWPEIASDICREDVSLSQDDREPSRALYKSDGNAIDRKGMC